MEDVAVAVEPVGDAVAASSNEVDLAVVREMLAAIDAAKDAYARGEEILPAAMKRKERSARVAELRAPVDAATSRLAQYLRGLGFGEGAPVRVEQDGEVFRGRLRGHGINIDAPAPMSTEDGRIRFYVDPGFEGWPGYAGDRVPSGAYVVDLELLRPGHAGEPDVEAATGTADDQLSAGFVEECRELLVPAAEDVYASRVAEVLEVPGEAPASLTVLRVAEGWHHGVSAQLAEGEIDDVIEDGTEPLATREAALDAARERLVRWLSDQKERGGRKHRKQAAALQERLLAMRFEAAAPEAAAPAGPATGPVDAVPRMVSRALLIEAPNNPRGELVEVGLEQLATSMRESGFRPWLPIVARLLEDGRGMIAAGHRRNRAAGLAGLTEVPCVLRPMTDEEFLDILNFDNGGREDVHPLYEASGWREWMQKTGKGVIDIARRIGMSKEYIYARLKYDQLIPEAKQAFASGAFTKEYAILIARRPEKVQKAALEYLKPNQYNGRIPSTREFEAWLAGNQTADLAEAKFDRSDAALLAGAGACGSCQKLQANDPGYVAETPGEDDDPADLELTHRPQDCCLDPVCFRMKTDNHFIRIKTAIEAETGGPVLQVSTSYGKPGKGVLTPDKYEQVKTGGQLAVIVDGFNGVGQTIRVKVKESPAPPKKETKEQIEARKLKEEEDRKAAGAKKKVELQVRNAIFDAVVKVAGETVDVRGLIAALLTSNLNNAGEWVCGRHGIKNGGWNWGSRIANVLPKWKDAELAQLALELLVAGEFSEWMLDRECPNLLALAKRHKVDAAKIRKGIEGGKAETAKRAAKKDPGKNAAPKKKGLSPAARTRIAAAQKRRWAEHRKRAQAAGVKK